MAARRGGRVAAGSSPVALALCALVLAGQAGAAAPPTPEQLDALERDAVAYVGVPGDEVVLSEARVSTVDPGWAAAKVAYPGLNQRHDRVFEVGPRQGLATFRQEPAGEWVMASTPSERCGIAVNTGMPIAAQYDLGLPNCGLAGARLGDPVFIRDAGGRWTSRPRVLGFAFGDIQVRLSDLGLGTLTANAGAGVITHALATDRVCEPRCGRSDRPRRVILDLSGYTHCQGRLTYRRIEWASEKVGARTAEKSRRFALPCPAAAPPSAGVEPG